jgi:hypothetical protein
MGRGKEQRVGNGELGELVKIRMGSESGKGNSILINFIKQ